MCCFVVPQSSIYNHHERMVANSREFTRAMPHLRRGLGSLVVLLRLCSGGAVACKQTSSFEPCQTMTCSEIWSPLTYGL